MTFVLDASVAGSWAFRDEGHPRADLALERIRTGEALVPSLWWFEIRNLLVVNERRKRLTEADTASFLQNISRLTITIDRAPDEAVVLRIARKHQLSVYDASYLELAQRLRTPLATLDGQLIRAARIEGVSLL